MLCTWCIACTFLSLGLLVADLLSFESLLKCYLLRETLLTTQCMKLSSTILYYITLFYFLQSMCHFAIILFIYYFFIMCLFTAHTPLKYKLQENRDHVYFWLLVSGFSEPEKFLMHHGDSIYIWCMPFLCTTFIDKNNKSYKKEVEDLNQQSNIPYSWIRRHGIIKIRIPSPK